MERIDISYGGERYSTGDRTFEQLSSEIREALAAGAGWIAVNDGEGARRTAHLLVTPGVPIALIPLPERVGGGDEEEEDFASTLVPS